MANLLWVRNGSGDWNDDPAADPATDTGGIDIGALDGLTLFPIVQASANGTLTCNFGGSAFDQPVSAGYTAWNAAATLDPAKLFGAGVPPLTNGNLTFEPSASYCACQATAGRSIGRFHWELSYDSGGFLADLVGGGVGRAFPGISYALWSSSNGRYSAGDTNGGVIIQSSHPLIPDYQARFGVLGTLASAALFPQFQPGDVLSWEVRLGSAPSIPDPACGATHTSHSFTAAWTPTGAAADTYDLQYRKVGDTPFTTVLDIVATSYLVTGLVSNTAYEFKVNAVNVVGESGYSSLFECSTDPIAPGDMMVILLPNAEVQFIDANGHPYAGGTLEMFIENTSTHKDTWLAPEGGDDNLNSNPIVLDAAGRAIIFGDGAYRTLLKDSDGNTIWDKPSFTYVSVAMAPVVGAATIADAVELLGINDLIAVEAAARAAADSAEQTARIAADAAEAAARAAADAAEATTRAAGDAALQAEIDALVTGGTFEGTGAAWCWTDNASGWMVQGGTGLTGSTATFFKPFPTDILGWPICTLRDMSVSCTFNVNGYSAFSFICSAYGSSHSDLRGGEHFSYIAAGH